MRIEYTSHFKRAYQKLPLKIQKLAEEKEILFRKNPFDPRLKTHKLHGKLSEFHSFSIDHANRIIFKFINRRTAVFLDVGDHDVYS